MVRSAIQVYARLRPEKNKKHKANYEVFHRPKDHEDEDFLVLTAPGKACSEYIDNRPESWQFSYHKIFQESTQQITIFKEVALPVIDSFLEGYNGTIFAYGQTGSGKTFSITGDHWNYEDRGILPRTLEHIFQYIRKHPENLYIVEVAYLEIYNENGYDLLDRKQSQASKVEDLPRVCIQEDETGKLHLKNLSFRRVLNEKDALDLLLIGDTNRVTTVTSMNPLSSRSHCIFTTIISVKKFGEDSFRRAKIHFVDLAGSERVYKCATTGTILTEAKHINLSLHYLEQVIVCLGQENANHIPYRNSLLTAILRDSLGGNCLTTMLTTLSVSASNLEETISSCRFAQRVALIQNDVRLILDRDICSENELLKMENERLRKQIDTLTKQYNEFAENDKIERVRSDNNALPQMQLNCSETCAKNFNYYKGLVAERDEKIALLIHLLNEGQTRRKSKKKEPGGPISEKCQASVDANDRVSNSVDIGLESGRVASKTRARKKSRRNKTKVDDNGPIGSMEPRLKLDRVFDNEEKSNSARENSADVINSRSRASSVDKSICLVSGQRPDRTNEDKTMPDKSIDVGLNSRCVAVQATTSPRVENVKIEISNRDLDRSKLVNRSTVTDGSHVKSTSVQARLPSCSRSVATERFEVGCVASQTVTCPVLVHSTPVQTSPKITPRIVNAVRTKVCQTSPRTFLSSQFVKSTSVQSGSSLATDSKAVQNCSTSPTSSPKMIPVQSEAKVTKIQLNPYSKIVDFLEKEDLVNLDSREGKSDRFEWTMPIVKNEPDECQNNTKVSAKQSGILEVRQADENGETTIEKVSKECKRSGKAIQKERSRTVIELIENFQKDLDATMEMIMSPEKSYLDEGNKRVDTNEGSSSSRSNRSDDSKILDMGDCIPETKRVTELDPSIPLTGDPEIDEEIIAYYEAKRLGCKQYTEENNLF